MFYRRNYKGYSQPSYQCTQDDFEEALSVSACFIGVKKITNLQCWFGSTDFSDVRLVVKVYSEEKDKGRAWQPLSHHLRQSCRWSGLSRLVGVSRPGNVDQRTKNDLGHPAQREQRRRLRQIWARGHQEEERANLGVHQTGEMNWTHSLISSRSMTSWQRVHPRRQQQLSLQ